MARAKRNTRPKLVAPEPPTPASLQAAYLTDRHLEQYGLDTDGAPQVLADASVVYEHVQHSPYATRGDLVKWAGGLWGDEEDNATDRLNAAMDFLERAGKLAAVNVG